MEIKMRKPQTPKTPKVICETFESNPQERDQRKEPLFPNIQKLVTRLVDISIRRIKKETRYH